MNEKVNTIIVGGGQAGLAVSYYLQQMGDEHLVLEASDQPANSWRSKRWDSFTLVTPNWSFQLPGAEYEGADRDGFMPRDEVVMRLEQYIARSQLPIRYGSFVKAVERDEDAGEYIVRLGDKSFKANNVVIATGFFQKEKLPPYAKEITPDILQLHSGAYRNPQAFIEGAVLVVGSAQSGAQIAEELQESGHKVYLCVSSAGRVPRRYRGRDIVEWLNLIGFFDRTVKDLQSPRERFKGNPHATGKNGGHTINLNLFYRNGMTLLGHARGYRDGKLILAPDLKENLAVANEIERDILTKIDSYIVKNDLNAFDEGLPLLSDAEKAPEILELDLRAAGIQTIIWACGYTSDYSMVKLPVCDESGFPVTQRGVTQFPGLYFIGLPWMDSMKSGLFLGIKDHAANIAKKIEQSE